MSLSLQSFSNTPLRKGPVLNVILDGIALAPNQVGNAFFHARTPCLDSIRKKYLNRSLYAHGHHVGMPGAKDMGNSEVGHNAIGAGRIFDQGAKLVENAIKTGSLYTSSVWKKLLGLIQEHQSALHLLGLLSDGNVHSHISHLKSLVKAGAAAGIKKIYLHLLTDGRDTPPLSSLKFLEDLEKHLTKVRSEHANIDIRIVSVAGRMIVFMDRYEANWEMIQRGWELVVEGQGPCFPSAEAGLREFHQDISNDQFIPPFLVAESPERATTISDQDVVVCFNFRGDRAIELSRAFEDRAPIKKNKSVKVHYFGMTLYDGDTQTPQNYLVAPPAIERTMGEYLVHNKKKLFAISETQKYGHVTYFWNGNRSQPFDSAQETYIEIKSADRPFEETPWMKAAEITDKSIECIRSGEYQFGRINYPNGDMVGHTGDFNASILAVEAVDLSLSRLLRAVEAAEGIAIVTADHGNCDEMYELNPQTGEAKLDKEGKFIAKTSHTLHPVPCVFYDPNYNGEYQLRTDSAVKEAGIAHLAATTLMLMGFEAPKDYLPSLIEF